MRPGAPLLVAAAFLAYACSQQAPVPSPVADRDAASTSQDDDADAGSESATPWTATIQFGHEGNGSGHALDKLTPANVVVRQGGTVYFETFGVHQLAIYNPGKLPANVDVRLLTAAPDGCPAVPLINDPVNRLAFISKPCGPPVTLSYTFTNTGRHLVICTFLFHFVDFRMYGWVNVR